MSNPSQDALWYKDAIIYELHIKAFRDENADGIGDFAGLIDKLDYIVDLGVTAIWLLPFYPSPQRDDGYDIADYYSINSDYGTIKQLQKLLKKAHQRGLKVITELVINHTSDQHPWFQRARKAAPGSPEREFYVWSDTDEKYSDARIIFQDFESSNWTWDPVAQAYYWHRFYSHQPDLNYDNPEVQEAVFEILDFWIDLGVDGFRLDAIPYLFEREGTNCENLPETHEFLKKLRAHVEERSPNVMLLAEANMWPEDSAAYFGEGDECHMNYHFPVMPRMFMALKMEDRYPITDIIDQTPDIPDNCQWALFLRNHDELTLEMVTDEERDYMYRAYNKDSLSRVNLGIRHRLAPLLDNHRQKMELMNCLLFSLPGTPVIYYGDEIGMGDNVHLGDRDGVRTPMQWSPDRNGGFSMAHPHSLYLPMINDPEYHFMSLNVETQETNNTSLLWWMRRIITVRKRHKAFGRGDIQFLNPENAKILAFTRTYEDETLLIVANLSRHPQAVELEMPGHEGCTPVEVFGLNRFPKVEKGPNLFTLGPYGYYWFILEPVHAPDKPEPEIAEITFEPGKWKELIKPISEKIFTRDILQRFLSRSERYTPQDRIVSMVDLEQARPIRHQGGETLLCIVKASFTEGFPEYYFLPVSIQMGDLDHFENAPSKEHIIAILKGESQNGFLYEATELRPFRLWLLEHLLHGIGRPPRGLQFFRYHSENNHNGQDEIPRGRVVPTTGDDLSLAYGSQYFLKVYTRIERRPNPDVEINQRRNAHNLPVPGYLGHLVYNGQKEQPFTLAMLQPYVDNQGSAYNYFLDVGQRYFELVQTHRDFPIRPDLSKISDRRYNPVVNELRSMMPFERAYILGESIADLHVGMVDPDDPDFAPESFSLHYQRSLFAAWQSQVRATLQVLRRRKDPPEGSARLLYQSKALIERLKRIYDHKFKATKIRTHADLHLEKVLFCGREFIVYDFEGERVRNFSELRLKKSPARDLASLFCSFYYAMDVALRNQTGDQLEHYERLLPWAHGAFEALQSSFMEGYLPKAREAKLIPDSEEDWNTLLECFMIERHLYELSFELQKDRGLAGVPLQGLLSILEGAPEPA